MPRYKMVNGERIQLSAAEETARDAEEAAWTAGAKDRAIANMRAKRDQLLKDSDWEVIMAKEKGTTLSAAFKTYRQDLRDLPSTTSNPDDVVFPTKP